MTESVDEKRRGPSSGESSANLKCALSSVRQDVFKWATKGTSLACENLMIAAEALGINTCPMEGFDGRRLSKYLGLSPQYHEIVMVIADGEEIAFLR